MRMRIKDKDWKDYFTIPREFDIVYPPVNFCYYFCNKSNKQVNGPGEDTYFLFNDRFEMVTSFIPEFDDL